MRKNLLHIAMLFISFIVFSACEKSETVNAAKLEGSWRLDRVDLLFKGQKIDVSNIDEDETVDIFSNISFSDDYITFYGDGEVERLPYNYSNGAITIPDFIFAQKIKVPTLTKSKLVLDIPIFTVMMDFDEELYAVFDRTLIYRSSSYTFGDTYWYFSGKDIVVCEPIQVNDEELVWYDTYHCTYKR